MQHGWGKGKGVGSILCYRGILCCWISNASYFFLTGGLWNRVAGIL